MFGFDCLKANWIKRFLNPMTYPVFYFLEVEIDFKNCYEGFYTHDILVLIVFPKFSYTEKAPLIPLYFDIFITLAKAHL